jgi:putative hydrolase of the HAD superfamily
MITTIIFDLDNCLAAADEPGEQLLAPTFDAIRRANHGTVGEETLERAFADCWRRALDWVAKTYGFSDEMLAAGWAENARAAVSGAMHGYPDIDLLRTLRPKLFLVTSGFRRLQESKVRALGLAPLFERIYIDAIDEPDRKGKETLFKEILRTYSLEPKEVLVVGDDAESEIAAGSRLGISTVQILRDGVSRADSATYHIASLEELRQVIHERE